MKKNILLILCITALISGCASTKPFMLSKVKDPSGLKLLDFTHIRQKERYDCGAGALAIVFNYWGKPEKVEAIYQGIFSDIPKKSGISAGDLKKYAEKKGFKAFLLKMPIEKIMKQIDKGRPVIVCRKVMGGINHYEVAVGYNEKEKRIIIADPANIPYSISYEKFSKRHNKLDQFTLLIAPVE